MSQFKNLSEAAKYFDLSESDSVENMIEEIIVLGKTREVYHRHDDFLGLSSDIPEKIKNKPIYEISESEKYEKYENLILDEANTVVSLSQKQLSDDEVEDYEQEQDDWNSLIENLNK